MLVVFFLNIIYSWGNVVWSRPFQVQGLRFGSCPLCVCAKHQLFWLLLHLLCALKKLQTFLEVGKILSSQYKFSYLLKACGEPQIFVVAFIVSHIGAWHGGRNFLFFSTSTVYQEPIMAPVYIHFGL